MQERAIIFQGWGIEAIGKGVKTQTRRVANKRLWPLFENSALVNGKVALHMLGCDIPCPHGVVGDLLYCRETWKPTRSSITQRSYVRYRADDSRREVYHDLWENVSAYDRWRPSIHMPKWAVRHWLRITDVRAERVQDISEEDAKAEGCVDRGYDIDMESARYHFSQLWDSIYAKRGLGWDVNPWVFVLSFKRKE